MGPIGVEGANAPLLGDKLQAIVRLVFFALVMVGGTAEAAVAPPTQSEALNFVTSLKAQNTSRLQATDAAIQQKFEETKSGVKLSSSTIEIEKLRSERRELLLRQDFLDRLTFQVDTRYPGKDLKPFLISALKNMAQVELGSHSEHSMWAFLNNMSLLLEEVPERQDRVLGMIENYMKQTTISNPMPLSSPILP